MVASRQVEIPYYRAVRRQRERGFELLHKLLGELQVPFSEIHRPSGKTHRCWHVGVCCTRDWSGFNGIKSFETAAKSVGKQTVKKQLSSGSKQRKIFPTKSTKQSSRSRFSLIMSNSIFRSKLLWQCLELLERMSQSLTMSCPRMNKKFVQLPQLMITALSLILKRIGTFTLIWDSLFGIEAQNCQRTWLRYIREQGKEKGAQRWVCCFHWNRSRR